MAFQDIATAETAPGALVTSSVGTRLDENIDFLYSQLISMSAGDYLLLPETADDASTSSSSYTKIIEFVSPKSGEFTFKYDLQADAAFSTAGTSYARIYRNGVAVGTENSVAVGAGSVATTSIDEDISGWSVGDLIQVYAKTTIPPTGLSKVQDFGIYGDKPIIFVQTE